MSSSKSSCSRAVCVNTVRSVPRMTYSRARSQSECEQRYLGYLQRLLFRAVRVTANFCPSYVRAAAAGGAVGSALSVTATHRARTPQRFATRLLQIH